MYHQFKLQSWVANALFLESFLGLHGAVVSSKIQSLWLTTPESLETKLSQELEREQGRVDVAVCAVKTYAIQKLERVRKRTVIKYIHLARSNYNYLREKARLFILLYSKLTYWLQHME